MPLAHSHRDLDPRGGCRRGRAQQEDLSPATGPPTPLRTQASPRAAELRGPEMGHATVSGHTARGRPRSLTLTPLGTSKPGVPTAPSAYPTHVKPRRRATAVSGQVAPPKARPCPKPQKLGMRPYLEVGSLQDAIKNLELHHPGFRVGPKSNGCPSERQRRRGDTREGGTWRQRQSLE